MRYTMSFGLVLLASAFVAAQEPASNAPAASGEAAKGKGKAPRPPRPGVSAPGVKRDMATIKPLAEFPIEGTPDCK